jgi:ribose transport system permease protein
MDLAELRHGAGVVVERDRPKSAGLRTPRRRIDLGWDRFSGLWVIALFLVVFCLWEPTTFRTLSNLRVVAESQAITGVLTLGLIVSLICGVFDLSVAGNMSLALIVVAWFQSNFHMNAALATVLVVMIGGLIGVLNAIVVTKLHVDAVIGTLGMSSILAAVAFWISQGNDIVSGISLNFSQLGRDTVLTIPLLVFFLAAVALGVWYLLDHTPTGRYFYALGFNANACRLAGVKVVRLQWTGLIISGCLASLAGVLLTMQLGAASYGAGASYLLPAFAAAFLGSTQIKPGRFNVLGTLVALYLLAIGVRGLQLKYPNLPWIPDLFEGLALIIAVALARRPSARLRSNP